MSNFGTMFLTTPDGAKHELFRYRNPDGSIGGWVSVSSELCPDVVVDDSAIVGPGIRLSENSVVGPNSILVL